MKLSKQTLSILKNFSELNDVLKFRADSKVLLTKSSDKTTIGKATIDEEFPHEFVIGELSRLLSVVDLYDDPDIDVQESSLLISDQTESNKLPYVEFHFAPPDLASEFKDETFKKPEELIASAAVQFELSEELFSNLNKVADKLGVPHIVVETIKGKLILTIINNEQMGSRSKFEVGPVSTNDKFRMVFDRKILKMMPGNYHVYIASSNSDKFISKFVNNDVPVFYYIPLMDTSTFEVGTLTTNEVKTPAKKSPKKVVVSSEQSGE